MRGSTSGLLAVAMGIAAFMQKGIDGFSALGKALGDSIPMQGKPGDRIRRRQIEAQMRHIPAGSKLAKKAQHGRLGMTHPTRGTMATPKGLRPFSMRGLPLLTPMQPKPMSTRQWKRKMHADGFRSVPDCRRLPPHGWKPS